MVWWEMKANNAYCIRITSSNKHRTEKWKYILMWCNNITNAVDHIIYTHPFIMMLIAGKNNCWNVSNCITASDLSCLVEATGSKVPVIVSRLKLGVMASLRFCQHHQVEVREEAWWRPPLRFWETASCETEPQVPIVLDQTGKGRMEVRQDF